MIETMKVLVENEVITSQQFEVATHLQAKHGESIGYHLIGIGAVDNSNLVQFFSKHYKLDIWDRSKMSNLPENIIELITPNLAHEYRIVPLKITEEHLTVGITAPAEKNNLDEINLGEGCTVKAVLISEEDATWALQKYYGIKSVHLDYSKVRKPIKISRNSSLAPPATSMISEPVRVKSRKNHRNQGSLIAEIHKAQNKNEIIGFALQYLRSFAERAAFLVVKGNRIQGFDIVGKHASQTAIRSFWTPISTSSTLSRVVEDNSIHLGPLGRSSADAILAAALGGRPVRIVAIPISITNRVVGILYADGLKEKMPPWNDIQRIGEVVATNFGRLILSK
jgi:hypothetical protein